jgi:site-specific recombinase XerD
MVKQIKVTDLCSELEQKLVELHYSEDSMRRFKKVFQEFSEYAGISNYSQSKGTDFLVWKFQQLGGFVTRGEHSKNEMYYFRVIRSLAEYYNFGILFRRNDFYGEIVWPEPFKEATENFLRYEVEYGCSHWQFERCKAIIKDLILFLDSACVHNLDGVTSDLISRFIATMVGLAPVTVAERISALRQYFKYAYLNKYTKRPIAAYLPHPPQRQRTKLPTVWTEEQIENLINAVDTTTPIGKRDYAIIILGARLGVRIGDILKLTINDIDWDTKQISFVQGKTRESLTLPLPMDVGWAIIDYLKNGRPVTDYPNIFVVHNAPYTGCPFKSTLRHNIIKALKRAGIQIDKTKHYGWHSLRHSLATNLLQNNVETSTISDILGHADPQVAQHYLRVDMKGLSKCALEVEVMDYVKE